jgi:hypothetical protein
MTISLEREALKISGGWKAYIFLIATLYLVYGSLQLYNGIIEWWLPWLGGEVQLGIKVLDTYIPYVFPDPFSGISLVIVGLILVKGVRLYQNGEDAKALGFLSVGWMLGIVLMILNILVIFANILDAYYPLLWGESIEEGWSLATDSWGIAPHLVLGVLALPVYWSTTGIKEVIKGLMPK